MKRKNNTLLSLVLPAVLCTALWGSAAPCVKKGYELFEIAAGDSFAQLVFAGWRFTLAGVLVLLVAACMGHRIRPKRGEYRAIFMISLFLSMLQYVCYYIGLAGTTGTKASVLSGTQTFFALLLAHALLKNDRLTRRKTLGCVLGFAGVLVLGLGGLDGFRLHGDGLILLSAVSAGAGALVSRIYTPGRDPMLLTGWQLALGGTFLGLLGRLGGGALGSVTIGGAALLGGGLHDLDRAARPVPGRPGQPVRLPHSGFRRGLFRARARGEYHDRAQSAVAPARQRRHRAGKFRRGFLEKLTRTQTAPLFLCRFCDFSCHRGQMVLY